MRIAIIGGTGILGPRLVTTLRAAGHEAVAMVAGEDLAKVLGGSAVVVDLSEPSPCTRDLFEYEAAAGVTHHVALSSVERGAPEQLIQSSPIPYSIVRATPLFESLAAIADAATQGAIVRVPPVLVQPIAADDVVRLIATIAVGAPLNGTIEIGGPEPFYLEGLLQRVLGARSDPRDVIWDPHARYGGVPGARSLVAGDEATLGAIRFADWLRDVPAAPASLDEYAFRVSDVPPGSVLLLGNVAVFNVAGGFCATQARCPHRGGALSEGTINDTTVTCPLHGAQFDIWTGAVLRGPATEPLETYRVSVEGDVGRVEAVTIA